MKILIDRNIKRRGVTYRTEMMPKAIKWGPHHLTVYAAQQVHRPPRIDEDDIREDLSYLASVCSSARNGEVEFYTSFELDMEADRQVISLKGYLGIDLLDGIPMKSVPPPIQRTVIWAGHGYGSVGTSKDEQIEFFRSIQDPRFVELNNATDKAHIADVFHLWTAEAASLDVFVMMDYRFRRVVHTHRKQIDSPVLVMRPKELCEHLGLQPIDIEKLAAEINPFS